MTTIAMLRKRYQGEKNAGVKLAHGAGYAAALEGKLAKAERAIRDSDGMLALLDQMEEEWLTNGEDPLPEDEEGDPDSSPTQAAYNKVDDLLHQLRIALEEYDKLTSK